MKRNPSNIPRIVQSARDSIMALNRIVREQYPPEAIRAWVEILTQEIFMLSELQKVFPEKFRPIAEQMEDWPGLISVDISTERQMSSFRNFLGLGKNAELNFRPIGRGKRIDRGSSIESNNVRNYYGLLKGFRSRPIGKRGNYRSGNGWYDAAKLAKKLKPLTRATAKEWWKAARPLFIAQYGNNFENSNDFKNYWEGADARAVNKGKDTRWVVRGDICDRHLQAFKSIAKPG